MIVGLIITRCQGRRLTSNPCYSSDIVSNGRLAGMKAKHAGGCWAGPKVGSFHRLSLAGSIVKLE